MPRAIHRVQYEYFRTLLIGAREKSGLTQIEVAAKLNKPQSFVSKYERGERRVDFTEFVELADILDVDIDDFLKLYRDKLKGVPEKKVPSKRLR
ncbi:helix-turn-helix transcriptional regulator [Viridibacterium curvum]|uniref:HTH cro/C1-type domain-containing protein n=1 Tax=Viridibacterium curvum TaxID=1101404 RepID=A0ABP9R7C3_9RHOO